MKSTSLRRFPITNLALSMGLFTGLATLPLHAQSDENTRPGYNEDEWYDPTDWFDGDNIEKSDTGADWWQGADWSDNTSDETNDTSTSSGQPYIVYYYYWDPVVAGWTSDSNQSKQSGKNQQASNSGSRSSSTMASFEGKVEGFKKVNLQDKQGKTGEYTFVSIRLKDGEQRVISLGSRVNLSDLDLNKGDQISVSGRNARIDNRDVLVANRIETGDQTFRIRSENRPSTGQQSTPTGFRRGHREGHQAHEYER